MEALGYGCHDNGLLFSLNAQMWSIELPLVNFGTPAQQRAYLPGLVSGDIIGGHAMTEPDSGSDALRMRTRAEQRGDHYVLNGTKQYITNAPVADVLLVYASVPGRPGLAGLSAFLVDDATPGPRGEQQLREDGPADLADGRDSADRLPRPGREPAGAGRGSDGHLQLVHGLGTELHLFASAVGSMRRQLERVRGIRALAQAVRPAHREVPGRGRQAGRHVRAAGGGQVADLPRRMARASRAGRPPRRRPPPSYSRARHGCNPARTRSRPTGPGAT